MSAEGFALDRFVDGFAPQLADRGDWVDPSIPSPLKALWIFIRQETRKPEIVVATTDEGDEPLFGPPAATPLLEAWFERDDLPGFDLDDATDDDLDDVVEAVLARELILAAEQLVAILKAEGIEFTEEFDYGLFWDDEGYDDPDAFAEDAREHLAKLPADLAAQLRAALYADPARSAWLD